MKAHVIKKEHEKFNLILTYDPKIKHANYTEDVAMLTVGKIDHKTGQIRVLSNFIGDEATELYNKLSGGNEND